MRVRIVYLPTKCVCVFVYLRSSAAKFGLSFDRKGHGATVRDLRFWPT